MSHMKKLLILVVLAVPSGLSAQGMDMGAGSGNETRIGGFADVSYRGARATGSPGFDFGGVDLFITSRLQKKFSFLAEVLFERGEDGKVAPDVERVSVAYTYNQFARVAVGRFHTPLGYWNSAFHHGALMAPTIDRPEIAAFEDDHGVLPMHTIGAMLSGRDIGTLHLGYDVSIGSQLSVGGAVKDNPSSGVTIALSAEPIPDFKFGGSVYSDTHRRGGESQTGAILGENVNEVVTSGYATWSRNHIEIISELHQISNGSAALGTVKSWGGYTYVGVRFGTIVPYAIYDATDANTRDAFYESRNVRNGSIGIRDELGAKAVVKFELRNMKLPTGGTRGEFATQLAIAF
jgi:hypothetical protein